jgi:hypothetical protein
MTGAEVTGNTSGVLSWLLYADAEQWGLYPM